MKTHTINTYSFNELSEKAQEKAIENNWDFNVNFDWWENTYEDAKGVGIEITSFDIDRPNYVNSDFIDSHLEVARKIISEHGDTCGTHETAKDFLNEYDRLIAKYSDGTGDKVKEGNELEEQFKKEIEGDYLIILRNEYEYLTSKEAIKEALIANEYEFTEDGKMY